jgi:hypothetical protein
MSVHSCLSCKTNFNYNSLLKRHLERSARCKLINNNSNNTCKDANNIEIKLYVCDDCNYKFKHKTSLYRHRRNSKCSRNRLINSNNTYSNNLHSNNTTNNLTNSHNTTNNNITNNNITNNNITIQHIYPFGFEDVRTIPISEMKKILTSGIDAGIEIIKTIYNKIENKNFYKPNISKTDIACLNKDFNLTIYKSREFADALFDRCIAFLHHMLYLCKNEYTKHNIKYIYDNIEHIETVMRTEIYDKKLKNIIETEVINNNIDNKDRIKKFIKQVKDDTDVKDNSNVQINNTISLKKDANNEYKPSIVSKELNKILGDPKVILGLKQREIILNLRISRFEDSIFYNYWIDRIKNIKQYVMNNKKSLIGDIINLTKEEEKITDMLDIIKKRVETSNENETINLNVDDEFSIDDIINEDEEDINM